jgi:fluoroacetyl-CoA thioesterase
MAIQVGLTAEVEEVVTDRLTAEALGNTGVKVYATPYVVCLMENAAQAAIVPHLLPGAGTVGTTVEMKHLAATPIGMRVRAKATLIETDGKRCLFQIDVFDEVEKIAEGRHERFIVPNLEKFLARAMSKGRP